MKTEMLPAPKRVVLGAALVVLCSCRERVSITAPTQPINAAPPPATVEDEFVTAVGEHREPRTQDPDPRAVEQALEAVMGISVVQLGRVPMARIGPPHADFLVFRANGLDVCATLESSRICHRQRRWFSELDYLGFAIVEFESPTAPRVSAHRLLDQGSLYFLGEAAGDTTRMDEVSYAINEAVLTSLVATDIDGDGAEEYVIETAHETVPSEPENGEGDYPGGWSSQVTRLTILRDDLTIQADGYVTEYWAGMAWTGDRDIFGAYRFDGRDIIFELCEAHVMMTQGCPVEILCRDGPTEIVTHRYDPTTDTYNSESLRRRSAIEYADWDGNVCLGPLDE